MSRYVPSRIQEMRLLAPALIKVARFVNSSLAQLPTVTKPNHKVIVVVEVINIRNTYFMYKNKISKLLPQRCKF